MSKHMQKWAGLVLMGLAIGVFAISCQEKNAVEARNDVADSMATTEPSADAPKLPNARAMGFSYPAAPPNPGRPAEEVALQNRTCMSCHTESDTHTMHSTDVAITCVDCHGGNWYINIPSNFADNYDTYVRVKYAAHVLPKKPELWRTASGLDTARNPETMGATSVEEHQDYIRFINPGDLRAAEVSCGACHNTDADGYIIDRVKKSMMVHGAMLWGAALYNNGSHNLKNPYYGEFYTEDGEPARVVANPRVTRGEMRDRGWLPQLWPLPRWEISQPGNILRVFERGGRLRPQIALPNPNPPQGGQAGIDDPGRPEVKLSVRGYGTDLRTDPVNVGLQKTRLMDPTLNFMGSNDHPGDYRASGCSACHVVYANDRSSVHSAMWSKYGNRGESFSKDPTVNPPIRGVNVLDPPADVWKDENPAREAGHPIQHVFVKNAPTSNCITCHMHPGTLVLNSYLGFMWWDNESDGAAMYPKKQKYPTADDFYETHKHNPEGSSARGLWSNRYPNDENHLGEIAGPDFLGKIGTPEFNARLKTNHFADFHGHGWVFRAVFKQDRKGNLLDHNGNKVIRTPESMAKGVEYVWQKPGDNPPDGVPVHLKDIHLEKGMHCVDCHFENDVHGDGHLYGETRNATTINCEDCHGTMEEPAKMVQYFKLAARDQNGEKGQDLLATMLSGNAGPRDRKLTIARNKKLIRKFKWNASTGTLTQNAQIGDQKWIVDQTHDTSIGSWKPDVPGPVKKAPPPSKEVKLDTKDPDERRSIVARYAHTIRRDGQTWGGDVAADTMGSNDALKLAHGSDTMSCYACHTSWNTSCFGCHLPQRANQRRNMLHNEAQRTRNYTNYNFQTLRDDVFMLGIDSTVKGHKVVPIRSACAVMVSSQDALRQWIYPQQQTVSAEGFAGTAFSPYFPHTVRSTETKQCSDCHISKNGDNNAIMAQVLLQGTNAVNFIGRFAWVGLGKGGMEAVAVTERDEPQAVIGSTLHKYAYPDFYAEHTGKNHHQLTTAHEHHGTVYDLVQRGEYVYTACGPEGFRAYDIANLDNKGFSERIVTAPVSPLGQMFRVDTKFATSITTPSTLAIDPTRPRRPENQEGPIHLMYAFLYVTDRDEGVVVIGNPLSEKRNKPGVATLLDGNPGNNFLKRAYAYNPDGRLTGATDMEFYGTLAYVTSSSGLAVIDFDNPLEPKVVAELSQFDAPHKIQFQFRYGFVLDRQGMHVVDVTDPRNPRVVPDAVVQIGDARDLYISRTYAYVAAGNQGLVIVDVTKPEMPRIDQIFGAEGHINDATAVKVGMTNSSLFAYVADGRNGLKVIQLTDEDTPGFMGFSPRPMPRLIAERHTHEPAIAIGEGLDRDRAVDESGNQLSVFGRRGARPFNAEEQKRLYLMKDSSGQRTRLYTVGDFPANQPIAARGAVETKRDEETPGPGPRRPGRPGRPRPSSSDDSSAQPSAPAGEQPAPVETPKRHGPRRPGSAQQ